MTFKEIAEDYRKVYGARLDAELRAYREKSLERAIRDACHGLRADGKRHIHQRHLPKALANRATRTLLKNIPALRAARNFHELQRVVQRLLGHIPWVKGALNIYDTTFRIGGKLGRRPRNVYLHCGTADGAAALGFDRKREWVSMDELPRPLRSLKAYEAEDVLCLYKDQLAEARSVKASRARRCRPPRGAC